MIEKLKQLYKSFYTRLGISEPESGNFAEESVLRMLILFTDRLLKSKLNEKELESKQEEYEDLYMANNYEAINIDLQKHFDENSLKLLIDSFMDIVLDVVNDLKDGEAINEQKISELGAGLKMDLENMIAVTKVDQAGTVQEGLQALAANNVEQVQLTQTTLEPVVPQAPVMTEPSQNVQVEPTVASVPVMGDQSQEVQNESLVAPAPVLGDQPQVAQTEPQPLAN